MNATRTIEIFTAGCPLCDEAVELVKRLAGPGCEVGVLDMHDPAAARRAKKLGVASLPAVVIDGKLAPCCAGRGPDETAIRAALAG